MHIEQSDFHDQLMRGLAHKMNNILSLFHGYLGLLLEDKKLDRETLEGLARIREGASAASELMDRTKAFAKPSSTVWREIDLNDFLRQMTPAFESYAERDVKIEITCAEDLPKRWADAARLRTASTELVRNACEASPANGSVKIDAHVDERPRKESAKTPQPITWISLTITDEGQGIAPELSKKIFQPFYSTKQKRNAMGLGLSVALGLVKQLGGVIRHKNKKKGTTFQMLLPSRSERF